MRLFKIDDENWNDKLIFARGGHHAAEQFVTWQMVNEAPMGSFTVTQVTIGSQKGIAAHHLREAMSLGIEGIGTYDEAIGWTIRPITDERPIPDWV